MAVRASYAAAMSQWTEGMSCRAGFTGGRNLLDATAIKL
jgi:hypothetical protein